MKNIKKILVIVLCTALVFAMVSCGAEAQAETAGNGTESIRAAVGTGGIYDMNEDNTETISSLTYGAVKPALGYGELYPELESALEEYCADVQETVTADYDELAESARNESQGDVFFGPYVLKETMTVRRADSNVFSILTGTYYYGGGAHGYSAYSGATFNSKTGEQLKLSDIVSDGAMLQEKVQEQLDRWYSETEFYATLDGYFGDLDSDTIAWTLDRYGLTIYFNQYDLAPYASGIQVVTVPYEGNEALFSGDWSDSPETCGAQLALGVPYYTDLDGDGEQDQVTVTGWTDEYGAYDTLMITVNETTTQLEIYSYDLLPMLIHTSAGTNGLYVQLTAENDYRFIECFSLNSEAAEHIGTVGAGLESEYSEGDIRSFQNLLSGDNGEWLSGRVVLLGTTSGEKQYNIAADGTLYSDDEYYKIITPLELTTKLDITSRTIDGATGETTGNEYIIPAGTAVKWVRTDGSNTADLELPDGETVRITLDNEGWPYTVDGIGIEEAFDGIVFAG